MTLGEPRARRATTLALGLSSGLLYAITLFPGVGGVLNHGDSAKFQFLGLVPGVGHPPGNPLYLALLALIQRIPFGDAAFRANLTSAACAAVAIGFLADATYRMAGRQASILTAVLVGLGGLFWEFATEAEVYALNGAFVAFIVYALVRAETERSSRFFAAGTAALIVGTSGHLSLVVSFPALVLSGASLLRHGIKPTGKDLVLVLGACVLSLGLYGLLPVVHAHSVYSEYLVEPSISGFIDFVTGAKWRSGLKIPNLKDALTARSTALTTVLLRQWILPLWVCAPLAFHFFLARFSATARFCAAACLSWLAFLYFYDIPDPDGLVVPISCCVAPAFGVTVHAARHSRAWTTAAILGIAPTALLHVKQYRETVAYDILEDVTRAPGRELLDMPDIAQRLPDGAYLALPCLHYGCVQVMNYYRFADESMRKRSIQIVGLRESQRSPWPSSPPIIELERARSHVVCTVHERESRLLSARGATMARIDRGEGRIGERVYERLPLYCSRPDR